MTEQEEEIVIDSKNNLERLHEPKDRGSEEIPSQTQQSNGSITLSTLSKPVNKLTDAERTAIIEASKSGVADLGYRVANVRDGSIRIIKKKPTQSIASNSVANGGKININGNEVHLTNDQLLFQHIIDLETKYTKMQMKHKKLKGKYKNLYDDIYLTEQMSERSEKQQAPEIGRASCRERVYPRV